MSRSKQRVYGRPRCDRWSSKMLQRMHYHRASDHRCSSDGTLAATDPDSRLMGVNPGKRTTRNGFGSTGQSLPGLGCRARPSFGLPRCAPGNVKSDRSAGFLRWRGTGDPDAGQRFRGEGTAVRLRRRGRVRVPWIDLRRWSAFTPTRPRRLSPDTRGEDGEFRGTRW